MSVKIRLSRIGKKHEPFYRVVAIDSRKKRDGAYLQDLGTYDVHNKVLVRFDEAGYQTWVSQGAQPSDTAAKLFRLFKKVGIGAKLVSAKSVAKKAAPKAEATPPAEEVQ